MRLSIERKNVKIYPDVTRVITRFLFAGEDRAKDVIEKIIKMNQEEVLSTVFPVLQEYSRRHRNISRIFYRHYERLQDLLSRVGMNYEIEDNYRKLLIGSFFTHEYSIESAAFFNPSMIEDLDQSELEEGQKRAILSFRAVGEGHISSIAFRKVLLEKNGNIQLYPVGNHVDEAEIIYSAEYQKATFFEKVLSERIDPEIVKEVSSELKEIFDFNFLKKVISEKVFFESDALKKLEYEKILWLADSYYEIKFSLDTNLSDRVIFPISEFERKGIEDARFVRFKEDDDSITFLATYTAYDGEIIVPKMLKTHDFYNFKVMPLYGRGVQNKNFALFPRKINGKFVMASRNDGVNNYIMYSDHLNLWENPVKIKQSKSPWEYIQTGNCGSPIETEWGWLLITHGVGPMRRYCLGASLLQLEDPSIEIGHLEEPLLIPQENEREGYVPNVLYSCGSMLHNDQLIIPYGVSDYCSSFARVDLKALISKLRSASDAI